MKILIIDDERATLDMFTFLLKALGHDPITAEEGQSGLELFRQHHPPVTLTDIKMPGLDGLEVLRRIKEEDPTAEVIVITGHGDMESAVTALQLDATDFVNKPVGRAEIETALERAEERLRLTRDQAAEMRLETTSQATILRVPTAVTDRSAPLLREALEKARKSGGLVISFGHGASINGAGLDSLAKLLADCSQTNLPTAITGLPDKAWAVLERIDAASLTNRAESEEEAVALVGRG
ncbi:response regulator [Desulfohalovibrio reitneri]|uniref:response regulator n=1 Tax=Desulfohalovibrio reitneri TaxID=1307759 RepID=UPI0004A72372|nr:response regulator [Desulfohalovibrio reitneri]